MFNIRLVPEFKEQLEAAAERENVSLGNWLKIWHVKNYYDKVLSQKAELSANTGLRYYGHSDLIGISEKYGSKR